MDYVFLLILLKGLAIAPLIGVSSKPGHLVAALEKGMSGGQDVSQKICHNGFKVKGFS